MHKRYSVRAYGHAVIARDNVTRVLASKVEEGDLSFEDAEKYAGWIFRQNAEELFFSARPRVKVAAD